MPDVTKTIIGGALYDVFADLVEKFTSRLNMALDPDLATVIAAWYLAKRYPQYADYLAGVAAAAASRAINVGGLIGAAGKSGNGSAPALARTAAFAARRGWGRIAIVG